MIRWQTSKTTVVVTTTMIVDKIIVVIAVMIADKIIVVIAVMIAGKTIETRKNFYTPLLLK